MRVRRLAPEEWRLARELRLRALLDAPGAFSSSHQEEASKPDGWWIEGMTKLAWFVAEDGETGVGLVAGMPVAERREVISMWVDPAYRGRGVADALLDGVERWARSEGATGLCLAVAADNDRATRFYERAGFTTTGSGEALRSRPDVCTTEMRMEFSD